MFSLFDLRLLCLSVKFDKINILYNISDTCTRTRTRTQDSAMCIETKHYMCLSKQASATGYKMDISER